MIEVVLLPNGNSLHVVHVHFHCQSVHPLLLVDHLLPHLFNNHQREVRRYRWTHPEELGVIVPRFVIFGIVHQLNLRQIHAVVVGLQNLLELKDKMCHNVVWRATLCYPYYFSNYFFQKRKIGSLIHVLVIQQRFIKSLVKIYHCLGSLPP